MIYRVITQQAILFRIVAAILIGGVIGLEREAKNRPAGLRTYMLVSVGSCLIMLTNQYIYQVTGAGDPMRLGAQVVSGIGFLGAGTIIVTRHNQIKGLTTAAGLWTAAGVGLALGVGFYEAAFVSAISIYLILTFLQYWESRLRKRIRQLEVYIELSKNCLPSTVMQQIRAMNIKIESVQFDKENALDTDVVAMVIGMKASKKEDHSLLIQKLRNMEGIGYLEEL